MTHSIREVNLSLARQFTLYLYVIRSYPWKVGEKYFLICIHNIIFVSVCRSEMSARLRFTIKDDLNLSYVRSSVKTHSSIVPGGLESYTRSIMHLESSSVQEPSEII